MLFRSSARLVQWPLFWVQAMFRLAFGGWTRCLILTDPPFMILGTLVAKRRRGSAKKCFWWTMDLYPEAMIAKGMIAAAGPTGRFLRWLNTAGLRRTDGVIALGGAQRDMARPSELGQGQRQESELVQHVVADLLIIA